MPRISLQIGVTALFALALFAFSISQASADVEEVDCNDGDSLQEALDSAENGDTIEVSGTCDERITIILDNLTLDGGGTAVIDGDTPAPVGGTSGLLRVDASNVTIRRITVQDSPGSGIRIGPTGSAVIQGTIVQDNARHGISVFNSGFAVIGPEPGTDNHVNPLASGSLGNIIEDNGSFGVAIGLNSGARIFHNNILGNVQNGIGLSEGGSADISGNSITGNRRGIRVITNASVRLSNNRFHDEANEINGNTVGVFCSLGGALRGEPQDFGVGNPGPELPVDLDPTDDHDNDTDISDDCPVAGRLEFPDPVP